VALLGDENCIELRDRSHLCYKSMINYDLDITNILVVSRQIRYIEVFDITNPRFNEQIWPVPSDFVKSRFQCNNNDQKYNVLPEGGVKNQTGTLLASYNYDILTQKKFLFT